MKQPKLKQPTLKNEIVSDNLGDISTLLDKKYVFFQDIIRKTTIHVQKCKFLDIIGISDVHKCVGLLKTTYDHLEELYANRESSPSGLIMQTLQSINVELSSILRTYGTETLEDLLIVCMGMAPIANNNSDPKFALLKKYFHPTSYSVIASKSSSLHIVCEDIIGSHAKFHLRVYGCNIVLYDDVNKKNLQITGIVDDILQLDNKSELK